MNQNDRNEIPAECQGCVLSTRREFVAGLAVAAGALISLGAPESLAALRVEDVVGRLTGNTVSYPIPTADGAQIDRKNQVILVRWQGQAYAFALSCPHENTALRWIENDHAFQCPKHKSRYQPDGTFVSGRATRGMDRFNLRVDSGQLVVDVSGVHQQNKDPGGWAGATVKVA